MKLSSRKEKNNNFAT